MEEVGLGAGPGLFFEVEFPVEPDPEEPEPDEPIEPELPLEAEFVPVAAEVEEEP